MRPSWLVALALAGCGAEERTDLEFDAGVPAIPDLAQSCPSNDPYVPDYQAPEALHQGACFEYELDEVAADISAHALTALDNFVVGHPACGRCLFYNSSGSGPLVGLPQGIIDGNVGACVATLLGDRSPSGCGAQLDDEARCEAEMCAGCRVTVTADLVAYDRCRTEARATVCAPWATHCADGVASVAPCLSSSWPNSVAWIRWLIGMFCGVPGDM